MLVAQFERWPLINLLLSCSSFRRTPNSRGDGLTINQSSDQRGNGACRRTAGSRREIGVGDGDVSCIAAPERWEPTQARQDVRQLQILNTGLREFKTFD